MKYKYYECPSNKSSISGQVLKRCVRACKKGFCLRYEKEQDGSTYVYPEDNRNWLQKNKNSVLFLIISLSVGSFLIPKLLF